MSDNLSQIREGIRNSAVIKNPVLFEAIGIAPVVAMAVSVKTAIMLSVISTAELIIIESFACLLLKKIKQSLRVLIYAVLGVLINIPFFMFFNKFAPNETANVSIFLPVLAVNSLIALHCERIAVKKDFKVTLVDAVSASVGYVFIIFLIAIIREVMGSGTFYSFDLNLPLKFSGLLLPFGGFLILGFLAAFFKMLIKKRFPDEKPEAAFNLSEISDKPLDEIKAVIKHEINPFDSFFGREGTDDSAENADDSAQTKEKKADKKKLSDIIAKKTQRKPKQTEKPLQDDGEGQAEKPQSTPEKRVYKSEFDDLLAELEMSKQPAGEADTAEAEAEGEDISEEADK